MIIQTCYFLTAVLFIVGLKKMSSPVTAAGGIRWAGYGMVLATFVTFFDSGMANNELVVSNYILIILALIIGGALSWWFGLKVKTTDLPQMIALYNGMGGGAAAAIAAVELSKYESLASDQILLGVLGALIGTVAFSGSIIAWAKLDGRIKKAPAIPMKNLVNLGLFTITVLFGAMVFANGNIWALTIFFILAFIFGLTLALPIGGADMPVVISLFNALTGLAVAFEGYAIGNTAMIVAGTVVGSAGTLLTLLMAKAMNRSLANVLFSGFGQDHGAQIESDGEMKEIDATDVSVMMAYADQVVIVPGYGMAVAQAQHKVWEMAKLLKSKGVAVKFAIHPVAGRMPGHMNVLLAEAGVPYDDIFDMEDINPEFGKTQVSLVIGANDVVNPAARDDPASEIYGMPILDVDESDNVIVIKRGRGAGFSGIENRLFFGDNTRMLFGDAQAMAGELIASLKEL